MKQMILSIDKDLTWQWEYTNVYDYINIVQI